MPEKKLLLLLTSFPGLKLFMLIWPLHGESTTRLFNSFCCQGREEARGGRGEQKGKEGRQERVTEGRNERGKEETKEDQKE
jgi:hypothetical protein